MPPKLYKLGAVVAAALAVLGLLISHHSASVRLEARGQGGPRQQRRGLVEAAQVQQPALSDQQQQLRDGSSAAQAASQGGAARVAAGAGGAAQQAAVPQQALQQQPRVLLRYTVCTGLINQFYAHVAAFSLASMLGADLALPPAATRDSFHNIFSTRAADNEMTWSPVPAETLLDVGAITAAWARRGIRVVPVSGRGCWRAGGGPGHCSCQRPAVLRSARRWCASPCPSSCCPQPSLPAALLVPSCRPAGALARGAARPGRPRPRLPQLGPARGPGPCPGGAAGEDLPQAPQAGEAGGAGGCRAGRRMRAAVPAGRPLACIWMRAWLEAHGKREQQRAALSLGARPERLLHPLLLDMHVMLK